MDIDGIDPVMVVLRSPIFEEELLRIELDTPPIGIAVLLCQAGIENISDCLKAKAV